MKAHTEVNPSLSFSSIFLVCLRIFSFCFAMDFCWLSIL